jgi:hypothetical protein
MVTLTYQDVLELLRYAASNRHPLEILGYNCSTRGARQFRNDRPDFLPQVCQLIRSSLEETGTFPRELSDAVRRDGTYLERGVEDVISLHCTVETGVSQTARVRSEFPSSRDAIIELVRRLSDPAYLFVPPKVHGD